jgi:hypothetical protein
VAEHSESTRRQYALAERGIAPQGLPPSGTGIINLQGESRGSVLRTPVQNRLRRVTRATLQGRYAGRVQRAVDDSGLASMDGPWDAGAADIVPIRIMMRLSGRTVPCGRDAAGWPR